MNLNRYLLRLGDEGLPLPPFVKINPTENSNPVSIQVNYGIKQDSSLDEQAKDLISVLRNYFSPNHQKQIKDVLKVPDIRWAYLRDYSKGFMSKVFDPGYNPTAADLYFDFFYRQSLEVSMNGDQSVWTMSKDEVKSRIEKLKYPVHVEIIKLNQLKIASLFFYAAVLATPLYSPGH